MKLVIAVLIACLMLLACGCGGLTANNARGYNGPDVSGTWEIIAKSTIVPGNTLLVESNFVRDDSRVSASGSSILLLGFPNGASEGIAANIAGLCPGNGADSFSATLSNNGSITYSLSEGGSLSAGLGSVTSTSMQGTYQEVSGACPDSGTFSGTLVRSFDQLSFTTCDMPNAPYIDTITVAEKQDHSLVVSGNHNGGIPYTLNGYRLGKVMNLTGDIDGQTTHLYAYLFDGNSLYIYDTGGQWLALCANPK